MQRDNSGGGVNQARYPSCHRILEPMPDRPGRFLRYRNTAVGSGFSEASGMAYTLLPNQLHAGLVKLPLDDRRLCAAASDASKHAVDVRDIASCGGCMTEAGHEGKIYDLTGPQALTRNGRTPLHRARSSDCVRGYLV